MKTLHTAAFLCTIGFALAYYDVGSAFEDAKIKPDILNSTPNELIWMRYGDKFVYLGNELTPTQVKDIPEILFRYEAGALYTLVMTDPDAYSKEQDREFIHWIVGNIPEGAVSKGEILIAFVGSAPPLGTGLHRYTFLLYKQNHGAINFDETHLSSTDGAGRRRFSLRKFTEKHNLGGPIAGNFYRAQYDDYVPTIVKQLHF